VVVWDQGTYEAEVPPEYGLADGELKIELHGKKFRKHLCSSKWGVDQIRHAKKASGYETPATLSCPPASKLG
jgi:hypothetical protein